MMHDLAGTIMGTVICVSIMVAFFLGSSVALPEDRPLKDEITSKNLVKKLRSLKHSARGDVYETPYKNGHLVFWKNGYGSAMIFVPNEEEE